MKSLSEENFKQFGERGERGQTKTQPESAVESLDSSLDFLFLPEIESPQIKNTYSFIPSLEKGVRYEK